MPTIPRRSARAAIFASLLFACGGAGAAGCSSPDAEGECTGASSDTLRTCAAGPTLKGIDVSFYQGTVNWASVKGAGQTFAFARISDGVNTPDSRFAANWPAMKKAGLVRGAYQYFRPSQDVQAQVDLVIAKLQAAGGLQPGDLPPVLDLETSSGLPSSTVISRAKTWLQKVEAAFGVKPIVYTAAFMSTVIGTSFGDYPLWVANYGATCPLMPSGWTDWKFWQTSQTGSVAGIAGDVDTNLFNGSLSALMAMTIDGAASADASAPPPEGEPVEETPEAAHPKDGSEGATLGEADPPKETASATVSDPCSAL
jgi:lysozyme